MDVLMALSILFCAISVFCCGFVFGVIARHRKYFSSKNDGFDRILRSHIERIRKDAQTLRKKIRNDIERDLRHREMVKKVWGK